MLIVDAQVHIWSAGPPTNPSHRQVNSYTAEECIRDMDAAGVNAVLLHPPGWDPNSGKISEEAAAKYPNRFGILGNFPLDKPESRSLIDGWKSRPGMLGLRYAFTAAAPGQLDDRRHDGLAVAGGREGRDSDRADGVELSAAGGADRRAAPRAHLLLDHYARVRDGKDDAAHGNQPALLALAKYPNVAVKAPARRAIRASPIPTATSTNTRSRSSRPSGPSAASGAPTSPACRARGSNA